MPGPHSLNSALVASSKKGESAAILPTSREVFAQPSRRWPTPAVNESSTVEWQSAQVMPKLVTWPRSLTLARTPTTAFSCRRATVTAGSSRPWPALMAAMISAGKASTSTLRPRPSAATGGTVPITLCICRTSVHSCSSPNVSSRKIFLPKRCSGRSSSRWRRALSPTELSACSTAVAAGPEVEVAKTRRDDENDRGRTDESHSSTLLGVRESTFQPANWMHEPCAMFPAVLSVEGLNLATSALVRLKPDHLPAVSLFKSPCCRSVRLQPDRMTSRSARLSRTSMTSVARAASRSSRSPWPPRSGRY